MANRKFWTPDLSRRQVLKSTAGLAAAPVFMGGFSGLAAAQQGNLVFGSASLGSTGYVIVESISAVVNRHTDMRTSSMSTSGGAENLQLIGEGMIDMGQSASTDWPAATAGEGRFGSPIEMSQMFAYTLWATIPIVRADSDIQTARDLAGYRVSPSTAGGSTRRTWEMMTEFLGVKDDIDWTYGSWRETYDAFLSGAIDCCPGLLAGGSPSPLMQELQASVDVRGLGWPQDAITHANEVNAGIMAYEVVPERWTGVSEPTACTASVGLLAAHPRVTAEQGYEITKAVFDNAEEVRNISMELENIDLDFAVRYLMDSMPVHAGSAQYFKEQGVWRDELTIAEG
jgi:TRAP transporter TAXI family solute receptor